MWSSGRPLTRPEWWLCRDPISLPSRHLLTPCTPPPLAPLTPLPANYSDDSPLLKTPVNPPGLSLPSTAWGPHHYSSNSNSEGNGGQITSCYNATRSKSDSRPSPSHSLVGDRDRDSVVSPPRTANSSRRNSLDNLNDNAPAGMLSDYIYTDNNSDNCSGSKGAASSGASISSRSASHGRSRVSTPLIYGDDDDEGETDERALSLISFSVGEDHFGVDSGDSYANMSRKQLKEKEREIAIKDREIQHLRKLLSLTKKGSFAEGSNSVETGLRINSDETSPTWTRLRDGPSPSPRSPSRDSNNSRSTTTMVVANQSTPSVGCECGTRSSSSSVHATTSSSSLSFTSGTGTGIGSDGDGGVWPHSFNYETPSKNGLERERERETGIGGGMEALENLRILTLQNQVMSEALDRKMAARLEITKLEVSSSAPPLVRNNKLVHFPPCDSAEMHQRYDVSSGNSRKPVPRPTTQTPTLHTYRSSSTQSTDQSDRAVPYQQLNGAIMHLKKRINYDTMSPVVAQSRRLAHTMSPALKNVMGRIQVQQEKLKASLYEARSILEH